MVSRYPLVTVKFSENEIALDQIVEKGDVEWPIAPVMYILIPHWKLNLLR